MTGSNKGSITQDSQAKQAAERVLSGAGSKHLLGRLWPFMGPAFIASIAYVDPGNFATNIQGGAKFGYTPALGGGGQQPDGHADPDPVRQAGHRHRPQPGRTVPRPNFPRPVVWPMWVLMELVAMATDLAEFVGAALGFNLLLRNSAVAGGLLTAVATFLILMLQTRGFRPLEAVITALLGVIALCYIVETFWTGPTGARCLYHAVVPSFAGSESVLLATGILGATVMPHVIFLHSSLTQGRIVVNRPRAESPALPLSKSPTSPLPWAWPVLSTRPC